MLTPHQHATVVKALPLLAIHKRLVIKGSAGVGKTYLVKQLLEILNPIRGTLVTAPTNKAVAVIKSKVEGAKIKGLNFLTTHSALELKMKINNKTGEITFEPDRKKPKKYFKIKNVSLLVVDEASMINTQMLEYIEERAKEFNLSVIFLGDEKQLNPVGEKDSPVFKAGYPEVELTEIIRQGKDNPIIDLSRNLRKIYERETNLTEDFTGYIYSDHLMIESEPLERIVEKLAEVNGTDELKYLAWTNDEVDAVNFLVRQKIYGLPNKVEEGETLIFNKPYKNFYYTNEEFKVHTLDVVKMEFKYLIDSGIKNKSEPIKESVDLKVYRVLTEEHEREVLIIHESSEDTLKSLRRRLHSHAKLGIITFKDYYSFIGQFADVKYNHAITVHKSQGSTYETVVLNVGNLLKNGSREERKRLLYTGITRASNLLILHNV
jgi:exodeoxyribonuclease-5